MQRRRSSTRVLRPTYREAELRSFCNNVLRLKSSILEAFFYLGDRESQSVRDSGDPGLRRKNDSSFLTLNLITVKVSELRFELDDLTLYCDGTLLYDEVQGQDRPMRY